MLMLALIEGCQSAHADPYPIMKAPSLIHMSFRSGTWRNGIKRPDLMNPVFFYIMCFLFTWGGDSIGLHNRKKASQWGSDVLLGSIQILTWIKCLLEIDVGCILPAKLIHMLE